jgi:hypothetical protein
MAKRNWSKVADDQFMRLDKDWQDDWGELRSRVDHH